MSHTTGGSTAHSAKKKRTGRFNLVDFFLILIVLLVIAMVIYVFAPFSRFQSLVQNETHIVEYTVEVLGVDETLINKIQENDTVLDSVSKNTMGTVIAVDYNTKYTELQYVQQNDQTVGVLAEHPSKYNIIITISATADYLEGSGYSISSSRIAVGEKLSLRFPDYACEGYCIALDDQS